MYKSLMLMCALVAPVFAQEAPASDDAEKKAPAPTERRARGERPQRPGMEMMRGRIVMAEKLVMEKYDANKDGKLDDEEKAKVKEAATKIREERMKAREERAKENKDEAKPGEGRRGRGEARGEGRRGPRGEGASEGERRGPRPGAEGRPPVDMEVMVVGQALLMEKYDTDKDGKLSEEERKVLHKDMEALKPEAKDKKESEKTEKSE